MNNNETNNSTVDNNTTNNGITIKCDGLVQDTYTVEGNYSGVMFGPELEFFVVDKETLKPKNCLDELSSLPEFNEFVKPELASEQIEILAHPSTSIKELENSLKDTTKKVISVLDKAGACILPVSLFDTEEFTITPGPRYELLIDTLGPDFRKNAVAVASDQINIGAENETQAFDIFNAIRYFLPTMMALSVSSPFKMGEINGKNSNRMDVYDAAIGKFPHLTGVPDEMHSLKDYAAHLEELPVFQHPNMMYKYMRPMPHRGVAAEIRSIDKQHTVDDYLSLVALTKAVVTERLCTGRLFPNHVDENFTKARTEPLAKGFTYRMMMERLSNFLEPSEQQYLQPLHEKTINGMHSDTMLNMAKSKGVEATYRSMISTFRTSLGC